MNLSVKFTTLRKENKNILKYTKTKAISSLGANWKSKCERLIKKKLME